MMKNRGLMKYSANKRLKIGTHACIYIYHICIYISSIPYYWGCMHTDGKAYKMYSRNKSEPFSMISCFIVVSCPNVDWKPNIMLPQWGGQSHPWLHNAFNIGCHLFGFICYYSLNILYQSCGCNLNISYHICTHVHQSQF